MCHLCKKVFASKQGLEVHQKRKICGPEAQKLKESVPQPKQKRRKCQKTEVQKLKELVRVNTTCVVDVYPYISVVI